MSVKTNVFMNWTGVTVSYGAGPTTIALTEVVEVEVIDQEGLESWQADGHKFATVVVAATGVRGLKITGGDCYKLAAIPRNTPCTVVAILNDARNQAGAGAVTHTLSNAVLADASRSGQTNKFAGGSATFASYSSDGSTDPLVIVQA